MFARFHFIHITMKFDPFHNISNCFFVLLSSSLGYLSVCIYVCINVYYHLSVFVYLRTVARGYFLHMYEIIFFEQKNEIFISYWLEMYDKLIWLENTYIHTYECIANIVDFAKGGWYVKISLIAKCIVGIFFFWKNLTFHYYY